MSSFFISVVLAIGAVSFVYNKLTTRRGIVGSQMIKLLVLIFIISLVVCYTILKFFLKIN